MLSEWFEVVDWLVGWWLGLGVVCGGAKCDSSVLLDVSEADPKEVNVYFSLHHMGGSRLLRIQPWLILSLFTRKT